MPIPPRDVYWEDLAVGDLAVATGRTVTEADIVAFAGLSGDYVPLHTDCVAAAEGKSAVLPEEPEGVKAEPAPSR